MDLCRISLARVVDDNEFRTTVLNNYSVPNIYFLHCMIDKLIIYQPGSYGMLLEWCARNLDKPCSKDDFPFVKSTGSSHSFAGNLFFDTDGDADIARITPHFVTSTNWNKAICLYADNKSLLWGMSSWIQKEEIGMPVFLPTAYTENNWSPLDKRIIAWTEIIRPMPLETLQNYNKDSAWKLERWEIRETLSFVVYQMLFEYKYNFSDTLYIPISKLDKEFQTTIIEAMDYLGITIWNKDILADLEAQWRPLQRYLGVDQTVDQYVNAIKNKEDYTIPEQHLTLLTEAAIQSKLRDMGIEINCYGLNYLPTNTRLLDGLCQNV